MKQFQMPYLRGTLPLEVPESNLKAVLEARESESTGDEEALVLDALAHPIGSQTLCELAQGKKTAVIVTSDHTRSMPSRITLPLLLREMRRGSPSIDVTILIATGLHRPTTKAEMRAMFGDELVDREKIAVHDAFCDAEMVPVCKLPSGAGLAVNRLVTETELLVLEGFIEPHLFAGFSGGRKSILPGVSSAETVRENHSFPAIASPMAKAGVMDGNPVNEDMAFAGEKVRVDFILNVTLDRKKRIESAFAGDVRLAHEAGCAHVKAQAMAARVTGDIVVTTTGGYPLDQNLYQSPKAVTTAAECAGENGVIIIGASCCDGVGGEHFGELMKWGTPEEIHHKLSEIPPKETVAEQWCVQLYAKILQTHPIILVTDGLPPEEVRSMNLIPAASFAQAMETAFDIKGRDASVIVIPDGVAVIVGDC